MDPISKGKISKIHNGGTLPEITVTGQNKYNTGKDNNSIFTNK